MIAEFPLKLWEADHEWNIIGNTATAGVTSGAAVDVRSDGGGMWSASLNNIQFMDKTYTLLWRAVRQICSGGVTPIVVHRREEAFLPFPVGSSEFGSIPHSDDTFFDDGSGYYQSVMDVTAYADAVLRDTTLYFELNNCGRLGGGESFSINHPTFGWRLYEIGAVNYLDDTHVVVAFNPPLREDVTAGAQIEFDRPRCTMKLVNSASMDLNVTTYPFSLATVKFIESKFS